MSVRTGSIKLTRGLLLTFALIAPTFVGGCATSHTHLEWGVRETPRRTAAVTPKRNTTAYRRSYAYREPSTHVVPRPRPTPAWYEDTAKPVPHDTYVAPQTATADMHFAWPVNGRVISDFGSVSSGERNDGINIAATYGEPIRAAADGDVSYSGNDLKSYGNLILIKHDGNYVTAYAHAERMLVSRGEHVTKGQVIAYAGNTGDVSSPQLHFEIRRGVQPVNPRPLLGPLQVASR